MLNQSLPPCTTQNPLKNEIETLRQILVWHLTEHTVPELIADTYSNIEMNRVQAMLGQPQNMNQLLQSTNLLASNRADA